MHSYMVNKTLGGRFEEVSLCPHKVLVVISSNVFAGILQTGQGGREEDHFYCQYDRAGLPAGSLRDRLGQF